jgi:hypothetical protein
MTITEIIVTAARYIDSHVGVLTGAAACTILLVLYARGQGREVWPFLRETLSERDPKTGLLTASSKRMTLLASLWMVLWGYAKLTLAVCRWVDKGQDPTSIYMTVTIGVLSLAGCTYIGGQLVKQKSSTEVSPEPNPTNQDSSSKEN